MSFSMQCNALRSKIRPKKTSLLTNPAQLDTAYKRACTLTGILFKRSYLMSVAISFHQRLPARLVLNSVIKRMCPLLRLERQSASRVRQRFKLTLWLH